MREQLEKYVELLFAGNPDSEEMKQEILQNTLDKFDDYIAQGKSAEAAYRLAISGIGDISEILVDHAASSPSSVSAQTDHRVQVVVPMWKKVLRAIAVFLFIVSLIPLVALGDVGDGTLGLVGMFAIAAVGVALLIIAGGSERNEKEDDSEDHSPDSKGKNAIGNVITVVGLLTYFAISFHTGAWHITWLVFPIMAAIRGLVSAIIDLKGGPQE
jgi:hypothetical protein